jgi:ABC-type sugar transport system substrate-binding protein
MRNRWCRIGAKCQSPNREFRSFNVKTLKFVASLITANNDYQLEQASAAENIAQRLSIDVRIIYANSDSITQSRQLLEIVQNPASNVDGIIVEPAGGTAFPQIARAAAIRGMAWAVLNRGVVDYLAELRRSFRVPILAVSSDHGEIGRVQGQQIAAILPEGGLVLYIQGPPASAVSQQRTLGMLQAKPDNISLKMLRSATWDEAGGQHAISGWLRLCTAHTDRIALIAAHNDAIALGARKAFEAQTQGTERERWSGLPYLGIDGTPQTGQAAVRRGLLTATIIVPPNLAPALEALVQAVRTGSQPPECTLISANAFPDVASLARRSTRAVHA